MSSILRYSHQRAFRSLESLLSDAIRRADPNSDASPVQRAICRVLDGEPLRDLAQHPDVLVALGGPDAVAALPTEMVDRILILAGIRCGKSLIAAMTGIRATQVCDVRRIGPGETPRVSIVSVTRDLAQVTWSHVRGQIESDPSMRALLVEEPTAESLLLRHPSGRPIEIRVVAGSRAASSLVARWSAGVVFDEAPRMDGSEDGAVVNLTDALKSIEGRMLPGAQILLIGSPWAPYGPVYDFVLGDKAAFGKPSRGLVVFKATAPVMNPAHWTPEQCERVKRNNPDAYVVDVLGEFMAPESGLFAPEALRQCTREGHEDLPYWPGHFYSASMDPATRKNAWALTIATLTMVEVDGVQKGVWTIALTREWRGSLAEPLNPREVMREIAALLLPYKTNVVVTDQHGVDYIKAIANEFGVFTHEVTLTGQRNFELFENLRTMVTDRAVSFPNSAVLFRDLVSVRRQTTALGVKIVLPQTGDGRHCDMAMSVALSLVHPMREPKDVPPDHPPYSPAWHEAQNREHREQLAREILARQRKRRI